MIARLLGLSRRPSPPPPPLPDFYCMACADRAGFYALVYRAPSGELKCGKCGRSFRVQRVDHPSAN